MYIGTPPPQDVINNDGMLGGGGCVKGVGYGKIYNVTPSCGRMVTF